MISHLKTFTTRGQCFPVEKMVLRISQITPSPSSPLCVVFEYCCDNHSDTVGH